VHESLFTAGLGFSSIRIGESFHCTDLMRLIDDLGYRIDSTALPGRVRRDAQRSFDWLVTPNKPYHPSRSDYRRPGQPCLKVLEIPMTTMHFKADYDAQPMLRYASLTYRPDIFATGLSHYLRENQRGDNQPIVFIVHPAELDDRMANEPGTALYSFTMDALRRNLQTVITVIRELGGTHSFCTLSGLASEWPGAAA